MKTTKNISTKKDLTRHISEEEFDSMMSAEYRMTKVIPELIKVDPELFHQETLSTLSEGRTNIGRASMYSNEQMIRAVILHTCLGSIPRTSHLTGIPYHTLVSWKQDKAWWPIIKEQVEQIRNDLLSAKLTEVIEEATTQMLDRVKNGNEVYDYQTGTTKRVPVSLKDLGDVGLKTALEKRDELRQGVGSGSTKKDVVEHLKRLADAFETMVNKSNEKVIEGEVVSSEVL